MIDSSKKRNRQLAFELQNSHVCEKRSNTLINEHTTNLYDSFYIRTQNFLKE